VKDLDVKVSAYQKSTDVALLVSDDLSDDPTIDIGKSKVTTRIAIGQSFVV
jgi:hypothetical protein